MTCVPQQRGSALLLCITKVNTVLQKKRKKKNAGTVASSSCRKLGCSSTTLQFRAHPVGQHCSGAAMATTMRWPFFPLMISGLAPMLKSIVPCLPPQSLWSTQLFLSTETMFLWP